MREIRKMIFWVLVLALFLCPIAWLCLTSVRPQQILDSLPPLVSADVTFIHFETIFSSELVLTALRNSLVVSTLATILSLSIGSMAAFSLAKLHVPFRGMLLWSMLLSSMFPLIALVSPLYLALISLGIRDSLGALVLVHTALSLPLAIWVLHSFFRELPDALLHAALIDGCSLWQAFVRIHLPLVRPGLAASGILIFIFSWSEFLLAMSLTASKAARTLPVAVAMFPGIYEVPWGEIAALSVLASAPLVVLILLFQGSIIKGITAGALKG